MNSGFGNRIGIETDWLRKWNLYSPLAPAITCSDSGRSLNYNQLFELSVKMSETLEQKFKIQAGHRVALLSQNEIESVALFFALGRLGAILVPINFRLAAPEVAHIIENSQPELVIVQDDYLHLLPPTEKKIKLIGKDSLTEISQALTFKLNSFNATPDNAAMIMYTSGTTGHPKGAILSHGMLFWNSINTSLRLSITSADKAVIFLPFFHTGGWNVLTTPFLHHGAHIILSKKFDAEQILSLTSEHKCNLLFGVPTTMEMMARSKSFEKIDLTSVRYAIVGGEPMPLTAIDLWHSKGIFIRQGYGLTEFGPNVFSLNEADSHRKAGSIGFPNFYVEAKIVGDTGQELGAEKIGELYLRGPMIMSGYWRNLAATDETIRNGWLATGDLVRRDTDGYYFVVGRKKEMYISGGENVYPAEVEAVLRKFPEIQEAAVVGVPDQKWGEVGKAFVVVRTTVSEDSIKDHCLKNLAKFKVPKFIQFMSQLPKGDSGKILKRELQ